MGIKEVLSGTQGGIPVWENLDLIVDGSEVATVVYTQKAYTYIERVIWLLYFEATAIDWELFGNDTSLTNGINIVYNSNILTLDHAVKSNEDFHVWGYDVVIQSDDKVPKGNVISARWTFSKSVPNGLSMWDNETFGVRIADDITALTSIDEFHIAVQGWLIPE